MLKGGVPGLTLPRLRRAVLLAAALCAAGVAGLVFWGGGFAVVRSLGELPLAWVAVAFGLLAVSVLADGARYLVFAHTLGARVPARTCVAAGFVNQFAAYVANLGPVAAAFVLRRAGVDGGQALAVALAKQMLFLPAALVPACLLVALEPGLASAALRASLVGVGVVALLVLLGLAAVAWRPGLAARWRRRQGVDAFVQTLAALSRRPAVLASGLALACVEQAALAGIAVALLQGLGGHATTSEAWTLALVLSAGTQVAPTPGGAGVSEVAGVWLFHATLPPPAVAALLLVWRFLAIQLPSIIGGALLSRVMATAARVSGPAQLTGT